MSEIDRLIKNVFDNLQEIEEKDKEIERLNNIINELEKWLTDIQNKDVYFDYELDESIVSVNDILHKLKELKEGK